MAAYANREILAFGPFHLDLRDEQLWRGEETLPLKAKAFAVLRCLTTHAGQLMTKDAIFADVWPETVVSESVLTVAVRQVRRALGDDARAPLYIETIHGRGYRFIAPVTRPETAPTARSAETAAPLAAPLAEWYPGVFVGRDNEWRVVQAWFDEARHGRRRIGFIAGEPGIGKTTLVNAVTGVIVPFPDAYAANRLLCG